MVTAEVDELGALEDDLRCALRVPHVVLQPSARVGIVRALRALGVPRGSEVIVSAFNCPPLIEHLRRAGWVVRAVDVAPGDACPDVESIAAAIGARTAAILATHAFGRPAPMAAYRALADRRGLALVEDAAQALGAGVGELGDATVYSFGLTKPLGAWGGGAVVTRSAGLAARVREQDGTSQRSLRIARGLAFELASRLPWRADPGTHLADPLGALRARPWHDAPLEPACAALVRARLPRLRAITERRRLAHARTLRELRARGLDAMDDAVGGIGFGVLVRHPRPVDVARRLGAARIELRAIDDLPLARALEATLLRVPVVM
ncbi:MAG: DegT/DnrJ/EryC1/StrS family aminotransferase [Sandaracinaceae bacterium]